MFSTVLKQTTSCLNDAILQDLKESRVPENVLGAIEESGAVKREDSKNRFKKTFPSEKDEAGAVAKERLRDFFWPI